MSHSAGPNTDQAVTRREHNYDAEAKRVQNVDPFGGVVTQGNFTTYIDVVSETVKYVGKAQIGTPTSSIGWQIMKITVSGTVTAITWAGATDGFTNEWDERGNYSYS